MGHDPTRDINEPAWQCEGVDNGIVDELEAPWEVGSFGLRRQPIADLREVCLQCGVVVEAHRCGDLLVGLATHGDLAALPNQDQLPLAGGGIHHACRDEESEREDPRGGGFGSREKAFHRTPRLGFGYWISNIQYSIFIIHYSMSNT